MTSQEMLEAAGFSDTPEGRAAFYKEYPTEESFMQEYQNSMRNGGRMGCMSCGGMKKYQGAGTSYADQKRKTTKVVPASTPSPAVQDSVKHQAIRTLLYEKGDPNNPDTGGGYQNGKAYSIGDWGYHASQSVPANPNFKAPTSLGQAVDMYMQEVDPRNTSSFPNALTRGQANDFMFSTGRDIRPYIVDQMYKSKDPKVGVPNRSKYNVDSKVSTPQLKSSIDSLWNANKAEWNNLSYDQQQAMMGLGRESYGQAINRGSGQGNENLEQYKEVWHGRIPNLNSANYNQPIWWDQNHKANGGILDDRSFGNAMRKYADTHVPNFINVVYQEGGNTQDQIMQLIQAYAQMAQVDPKEIIKQLQQLPEDKQQEAIQQMSAALQQGQQSQGEEQAEGQMSNPQEESMEQPEAMKRGGIHLDPAKRGTFKAQATRMHMSMSEAANKILNAPEGEYSPAMRRKANFYKNFAKAYGGSMEQYQFGTAGVPALNQSDVSRVLQTAPASTPNYYYSTPTSQESNSTAFQYFPNPQNYTAPMLVGESEPQSEVAAALGIKSERQKYKEAHPYKIEVLNSSPVAKELYKGMEKAAPFIEPIVKQIEFGLHTASPAEVGSLAKGLMNRLIHQGEHAVIHEGAMQGAHALDKYTGSHSKSQIGLAESSFKKYGGYSNRYQEGGSQDQMMQIIEAYSQVAQVSPEEIVKQLQQMSEEEQQQALQQMVAALQQGQQNGAEEQAEGQMSNPQEEEMEEEEAPMSEQEMEHMRYGGIPQHYRNMGFNRVGAKRQSTRPGKKWMVLAKKGDKYKIIHGGYKGMQDFKQHHNSQRRENFWNRMGGKDSAKANDPFSPLYWHKRFGTWANGGNIPMYAPGGGFNDPNMTQAFITDDNGNQVPTNTEVGAGIQAQQTSEQEWNKLGNHFAGTPASPAAKTGVNPWHASLNFGKNQRSLKDLNYDPKTFSGKVNRGAVMATTLSDPNSMLWTLPDKGISGAIKAGAGIASGLSGSYLGYAKAFGNRNVKTPSTHSAPIFTGGKNESNSFTSDVNTMNNTATEMGKGLMNAYGVPEPIRMDPNQQQNTASIIGEPTPGRQYGGYYQGGGTVMTFEEWKTKNAATIVGITDEATLKTLYDNYVRTTKAADVAKTPDKSAAKNAYMGFAMANNAIGAMGNQNQYQQHLQQSGNTDNRFQPYEPTNPFGNYTPNAGPASNYALAANTPAQDFGTGMSSARYGGMYEEGGVYELSPEEIQSIIQQGGEIEYV